MLKVDFPAIKEWKIDASQKTNSWLLPEESHVELEFTDFDINFNTQLELFDDGFLKPVVYELEVKFGSTYVYHDNFILSFIMGQFIEFAIVVIENSTYFVGQYIFSSLLAPMLAKFTNGYQLPLTLYDMYPGQGKTSDQFVLDYRSTHMPVIGNGYLDLFIVGDLLYNGEGCNLQSTPMTFKEDETKFSQFVISESALACFLNQVAKSKIGKLDLNESKFNALFMTNGIKLDTQSIYEHLPIFQNKLGQDKEPVPLRV